MVNKAMSKTNLLEDARDELRSRNSIFASLERAEYCMSDVEVLVPNEPAAVWLVRGLQRLAKVPSWRDILWYQG